MNQDESKLTNNEATYDASPKGLGGWLGLVGIGLCLSPIALIVGLYAIYAPLMTHEGWSFLTDYTSPDFNPSLSILTGLETGMNFGLFVAYLYMIYGFFKKRKWFPVTYISILSINIVFLVADGIAGTFIFPNEPHFDKAATKDLTKSIVSALIWVPYMLVSRRVRNTFVD